MMFGARFIACLFLIFVATNGLNAAPLASVEILQAPAWLIRDDVRQPLTLAAEIKESDRIETGANGRAILRLAEGSLVKLGADADFNVSLIDDGNDSEGVFVAFLDVLKGAFRFTTTELGKLRKREVAVQLRSVTIGIRGTDVWGKTEEDRDFVVLLDGEIEIDRNGETFQLDQPQSLFMAPRDAPAEPIGPVDPDDLAQWAEETEPKAGSGVQSIDGQVKLNLVTTSSKASTQELLKRLGEAGYSANVMQLEVGGRTWFHVSQSNFVSRADAEAMRVKLQSFDSLSGAWLEQE